MQTNKLSQQTKILTKDQKLKNQSDKLHSQKTIKFFRSDIKSFNINTCLVLYFLTNSFENKKINGKLFVSFDYSLRQLSEQLHGLLSEYQIKKSLNCLHECGFIEYGEQRGGKGKRNGRVIKRGKNYRKSAGMSTVQIEIETAKTFNVDCAILEAAVKSTCSQFNAAVKFNYIPNTTYDIAETRYIKKFVGDLMTDTQIKNARTTLIKAGRLFKVRSYNKNNDQYCYSTNEKALTEYKNSKYHNYRFTDAQLKQTNDLGITLYDAINFYWSKNKQSTKTYEPRSSLKEFILNNKHSEQEIDPTVYNTNDYFNNCYSRKTHIKSHDYEKPTFEQVRHAIRQFKGSEHSAISIFNRYESLKWQTNGKPIKNWVGLVKRSLERAQELGYDNDHLIDRNAPSYLKQGSKPRHQPTPPKNYEKWIDEGEKTELQKMAQNIINNRNRKI